MRITLDETLDGVLSLTLHFSSSIKSTFRLFRGRKKNWGNWSAVSQPAAAHELFFFLFFHVGLFHLDDKSLHHGGRSDSSSVLRLWGRPTGARTRPCCPSFRHRTLRQEAAALTGHQQLTNYSVCVLYLYISKTDYGPQYARAYLCKPMFCFSSRWNKMTLFLSLTRGLIWKEHRKSFSFGKHLRHFIALAGYYQVAIIIKTIKSLTDSFGAQR